MNLEKLRAEIANDEGIKHEIYLDHLDLPTFGIGHLVLKTDEDYGAEVGTPVSEERVNECFDNDVKTVIKDCEKLYKNFDDLPEDVQRIIANMMFNMGRPRLSKFKGMKRNVDEGNWNGAADEMVDSKWYRQVTNRAERLVNRMRNVG